MDTVRQGVIVVTANKFYKKEMTFQIKDIRVKGNMFEMLVYIYEGNVYPKRKLIVKLNNINNDQTYAVLMSQFVKPPSERERKDVSMLKILFLKKLSNIIERLKIKGLDDYCE